MNLAPGALSPTTLEATKTIPAMPSATTTAINVFIVEDNVVNSRVLTKQLQKHGLGVTVANHGGEALDVLRGCRHRRGNGEEAPDISLILMDLEMPVMDGLTCTRTIRELEKESQLVRSIPIIAVSANARIEQIDHTRQAGVVRSPLLMLET
jgi:CheY-like chemotaxis protein